MLSGRVGLDRDSLPGLTEELEKVVGLFARRNMLLANLLNVWDLDLRVKSRELVPALALHVVAP